MGKKPQEKETKCVALPSMSYKYKIAAFILDVGHGTKQTDWDKIDLKLPKFLRELYCKLYCTKSHQLGLKETTIDT